LSAGRHERSWLHRFLRQGRESAPGQIAWRIGMGRLAFEEGRLALAEAEFREALSIASRGPERAPLHLALAEIAMRRGKRDVAARELELALAADPTHAPARRLQARLAGR
ncbi:MAG: tetratricopeptide repeat protein, partial [Planctomycetota bacterium]